MHFIVVIEKATGKVVEKVDVAQTSRGNQLQGELTKITRLLSEPIVKKYDPDKYQVVVDSANSLDEFLNTHPDLKRIRAQAATGQTSTDSTVFRMEASFASLIMVNLAGIVLGILLLLVAMVFVPILFVIGVVVLIVYFGLDFMIWQNKGIRIIEVDGRGMNFIAAKTKNWKGLSTVR